MLAQLHELGNALEGDFFTDKTMRTLYATDASAYREMPMAVAIPKSESDIKKIIDYAREHGASLIPRTAGTSLAGQVVGNGIVVDVSKHFTKILEVNKEQRWARVQPGVIRNDLNKYLASYGLFFAPETSTASRCMIGGMVGNNSCGAHSVIYGTTRDHLLELETILADGSKATFKKIDKATFDQKCEGSTLESGVYRHFRDMLSNPANQAEIRKEFPKRTIRRRNTGYAIDELLETEVFNDGGDAFNFCKLLAGSEGTLAFTTEIKINLTPLPPKERGVLCIHSHSIDHSMKATVISLKYKPGAVELMDKIILDCTKENIEQSANRYFVEGDPAGVIIVEFERETKEEIEKLCADLTAEIKDAGYGYAFPIVWGADCQKVWSLREAGLGLLANIPGDDKGVPCIEDTAVEVADLPAYIAEFDQIMAKYNKSSVYYAHAGDGEIHLRPILDLKKSKDRDLFYQITNDVADLVKKYRGSLSGEHGDGRVRAPFIKKMIGEHNYALVESVKKTWDPWNIFNPGKIVNAAPMNEFLRYEKDQVNNEFETMYDFSETKGILRMAEKCNGTALCRKTEITGGTMCPSYMGSRNEKDTTRARANILREFLTRSDKKNKFAHPEIHEVMDLCLGCKGCKSECPSNVDLALMKSEFLHQYYKEAGVPFKANMVAKVAKTNEMFSSMPWLFNLGNTMPVVKDVVKKAMGIHPKRDVPLMYKTTLRNWAKQHTDEWKPKGTPIGKLYFFADEVVNFNDVPIGIAALKLLGSLGYEVVIPDHKESGRPAMSKGVLDYAQSVAVDNVRMLKDLVTDETPLVGIEPSAILSFRDEYPRLVADSERDAAKKLGKNALLIDEFFSREIKKGNISPDQFVSGTLKAKIHGHCHQKALSNVSHTKTMLEVIPGSTVEVIPSGCCGMSGSFGYDEDKYELSMKIGELVLFPAVRNAGNETIIAAPGTSCRHQIKDGTGVKAKHPVEILLENLKK